MKTLKNKNILEIFMSHLMLEYQKCKRNQVKKFKKLLLLLT